MRVINSHPLSELFIDWVAASRQRLADETKLRRKDAFDDEEIEADMGTPVCEAYLGACNLMYRQIIVCGCLHAHGYTQIRPAPPSSLHIHDLTIPIHVVSGCASLRKTKAHTTGSIFKIASCTRTLSINTFCTLSSRYDRSPSFLIVAVFIESRRGRQKQWGRHLLLCPLICAGTVDFPSSSLLVTASIAVNIHDDGNRAQYIENAHEGLLMPFATAKHPSFSLHYTTMLAFANIFIHVHNRVRMDHE